MLRTRRTRHADRSLLLEALEDRRLPSLTPLALAVEVPPAETAALVEAVDGVVDAVKDVGYALNAAQSVERGLGTEVSAIAQSAPAAVPALLEVGRFADETEPTERPSLPEAISNLQTQIVNLVNVVEDVISGLMTPVTQVTSPATEVVHQVVSQVSITETPSSIEVSVQTTTTIVHEAEHEVTQQVTQHSTQGDSTSDTVSTTVETAVQTTTTVAHQGTHAGSEATHSPVTLSDPGAAAAVAVPQLSAPPAQQVAATSDAQPATFVAENAAVNVQTVARLDGTFAGGVFFAQEPSREHVSPVIVALQRVAVPGPLAIEDGTPVEENDVSMEGAGLAPGAVNLDAAALDAALQQFLDHADAAARALGNTLTYSNLWVWLLVATTAGAGALEIRRRRNKLRRAALVGAESLSTDSTLSWVPGMPGSFSDEAP